MVSAFNYELEYVQERGSVLADPPVQTAITTDNTQSGGKRIHSCQLLNMRISDLTLTKNDLQTLTCNILSSRVIAYIDSGWPRDKSLIPLELLTFNEKRDFQLCHIC